MLYLLGITISNGATKKSHRFKKLHIPFKNEKELEKFRCDMEVGLNPGLEKGELPKIRVFTFQTHDRRSELFELLNKFNYICTMDFNKVIEEKGLKKIWVADQIGISNVMLSYYLTNVRPMPEKIAVKLTELLS